MYTSEPTEEAFKHWWIWKMVHKWLESVSRDEQRSFPINVSSEENRLLKSVRRTDRYLEETKTLEWNRDCHAIADDVLVKHLLYIALLVRWPIFALYLPTTSLIEPLFLFCRRNYWKLRNETDLLDYVLCVAKMMMMNMAKHERWGWLLLHPFTCRYWWNEQWGSSVTSIFSALGYSESHWLPMVRPLCDDDESCALGNRKHMVVLRIGIICTRICNTHPCIASIMHK